jgi:6-phosphogluconolactonase
MTVFPRLRLRWQVLLLFAALTASLASAADFRELVYVGTYTDKDSKGIYVFSFNPATGESGPVELAAESPSPSFLAVDSGGTQLYAVNEVDTFDGGKTGAISAFEIDRASGKLKLLQQVSSAGAGPAHLSLDRSGKYLLVANYGGGNFAVYRIESDGRIGPRTAFVQDTGSSVNKDRQASPHAHEIRASNDNRFVLVADLGTDELLVYRFYTAAGTLTPNKPAYTKLTPGSGPRHFAWTPSGKYLYVVNELANNVVVFSFNASTGQLHNLQTISTLPQGFKGENTTAEIQVDAAGKTLYVSNRGDDSIAVFAIDGHDGKLSLVERVPTGGKEPRHFTLDPTGKWLFAANQNSDTINVFSVDGSSGRLTATSHTIRVPAPVCVVPVALR